MSSILQNRRGIEGTWWEIVGAAMAILMLVVMVAFFTGQTGSLGKKYNAAAPTATVAEKTGWCIDALTSGKACNYQEGCQAIASEMGGSTQAADTPEQRKACKGQHAYSETEDKFCCITFGGTG